MKAVIYLKTEQEVTFSEATDILMNLKNKLYPGYKVVKRYMVRGKKHMMKIVKD